MSEDSKPHSELADRVRQALQYRYHSGTMHHREAVEALDSLVEQLEAARETIEVLQDENAMADLVASTQEQLEAANERLSQYEEPGYITAVQKVQQLKEQLETFERALRDILSGGWEGPNELSRAGWIAKLALQGEYPVEPGSFNEAFVSNPASSLTCGKCGRSITEAESQWGWCPECAAADPDFLPDYPASEPEA